MITSLRRMVTCHWSARRIGRYLDQDPSAPLAPEEVRRLEDHLAVCEKCTRVTDEQRTLSRALTSWSQTARMDEGSLARLRQVLDQITAGGDR